MTADPMQTDQPNAAERAEPVTATDESWETMRLREAYAEIETLAVEVRTLRAEVERLHEVRQSVIRENQKAWKRTREAESDLASEREKVAPVLAAADALHQSWLNRDNEGDCEPLFDALTEYHRSLDTTNEGAETG